MSPAMTGKLPAAQCYSGADQGEHFPSVVDGPIDHLLRQLFNGSSRHSANGLGQFGAFFRGYARQIFDLGCKKFSELCGVKSHSYRVEDRAQATIIGKKIEAAR